MSLYRIGFEKPPFGLEQLGCPTGQVIPAAPPGTPLKVVVSREEFGVLVTPADCGHDAVPAVLWHSAGAALAPLDWGAPMEKVSTPEEARVSLCMMVLLTMFTFNASCNDIPAPSQPAMLLTMMLLVMVTSCQSTAVARAGLASVTNARLRLVAGASWLFGSV